MSAPGPLLYDYWRSSASYRVRIVLGLAELEYDTVSVDLVNADHRSAAHLSRNPQGLVPVLEIDGQRFTQSLAIVSYLNRTRQLGLLPDDPVECAHVEALAQAIAVDIHPVCNLSVARYGTGLSEGRKDMGDWMQRFIRPGLSAVETLMQRWEQSPYMTGERISLADVCLVPQLYNAHRWQIDLGALTRLTAVEAALHANPAFAAAHPDRHKPS